MATVIQIDAFAVVYGNCLTSLRMLRGLTGAVASNLVLLPVGFLYTFIIASATGKSLPLSPLSTSLVTWLLVDLMLLVGSFSLLRRIWAGSANAARRAVFLVIGLNTIPVWLLYRGSKRVYMRPPLMLMELVSVTVVFLILYVAVRGLIALLKASRQAYPSTLFRSKSLGTLQADIYRIMGVPVAEVYRDKMSRSALWLALTAFMLEGAVFYTYFTVGTNFHKTAMRFRAYEVRHAESILVGFGPVLLTIGASLLVGLLAAQGFLYLARRLRLRSRRSLVQSYGEQRRTDPRPPLLFLRPFRDDQISLRNAPLRWYMRLFDPGVKAWTLEEMLVQNFAEMGPTVAIGDPADELPPVGASRLYAADQSWQDVVCSLMDDSQKIIVAVSDTESVWWEIETLVHRAHLAKTVFVLPPDATHDRGLLDKLLSHIDHEDVLAERATAAALVDGEDQGVIALMCDATGQLSCMVATDISELDYDVALRCVLMAEDLGPEVAVPHRG